MTQQAPLTNVLHATIFVCSTVSVACITPHSTPLTFQHEEPTCRNFLDRKGEKTSWRFSSQEYDWSDYFPELYWTAWRSWHRALLREIDQNSFPDPSEQQGPFALNACCVIRFTLKRDGHVEAPQVLEATGNEACTRAAIAAVQSGALPRLPRNFPRDQEVITGEFSMKVEDLSIWRVEMKQLYDRGVF